MRFAFVTSAALPELTADDRRAVQLVAARGHTAVPAVWTDPAIDWAGFDLVVLRSCWDYHKRFGEFDEWLARLASLGVPLANPARTARWNAEKGYLHDLEAAGVATVPSLWLPRGTATSLGDLRARLAPAAASQALVIKPTVSATAWLTWQVAADADALPGGFEEALAERDFVVQPFVEEIAAGEWSLVFFDGAFSHAVIKRPRQGEFRVQEEFGGRAEAAEPPPALIALAAGILRHAPTPTLYARVDGVEAARGFVLLELELLEPALYLASDASAARRFANAIEAWGAASRMSR